jgi:hypothetical protein
MCRSVCGASIASRDALVATLLGGDDGDYGADVDGAQHLSWEVSQILGSRPGSLQGSAAYASSQHLSLIRAQEFLSLFVIATVTSTMAHYDIFRNQLAIRFPAHGYALWEPSPGDLYHVVGIGDVGYITEGRFHRLFNILLPADDPSHENFGVPDNHTPFRPKVPRHVTSGILRPDNFCSAGVTFEFDEYSPSATRLSRCIVIQVPCH